MTKLEYIDKYRDIVDEASRRMHDLRAAKEATPALKIIQSNFTGNANKVRFNKKMSRADLERAVAEAKRFVKSKSSTVEGMRDIRVSREETLGNVVDQYGDELTANTSDFFRVLGSKQFQRAVGEIASDIVIAYVNRLISSGKSAATVKGMLTREITKATSQSAVNPQIYLRSKWKI